MSDPAQLLVDHLDIWTGAIERKNGAGRGNGNGGKLSLYGIERLRSLILDLAVRGKLVPQAPADEPASELMKGFRAQRAQWISAKRIRNGKPLEPISDQDCHFAPPPGWQWTRFGELGDWGAGATPDRKVSSYYGGDTPWFKSGELVGDYISQSEETVTELALQECSLRLNSPGDVLIAMYGATIGKTSILQVEATTNQAVCACTAFDGVDNRFLLLLLKAMRPIFVGQGAGGAQPNISREKIIATPLCLPPLAEQRRIVAKVDELMALCDALDAGTREAMAAHEKLVRELLATLVNSKNADDVATNWSRIETHFDTLFTTEESIEVLKQTFLDLAIRGKLVRQDPNDEPASKLLAYIDKQRRMLVAEKKAPKPRPLPSRREVGWPFLLPENWEWSMLGELCYQVSDGPHFSPSYVDETRGVPFLSTRNVRVGSFDLSSLKYVSHADHEEFCKRIRPEANDVLYTKGGTTGIAKVNDLDFDFSVWVHLAVLRIEKQQLEPRYVELALNSPHCFAQSQLYTQGIANFDLGLTRMIKITVPLPPLSEQKRIVARVDQLNRIADALKQSIVNAQRGSKELADVVTGAQA